MHPRKFCFKDSSDSLKSSDIILSVTQLLDQRGDNDQWHTVHFIPQQAPIVDKPDSEKDYAHGRAVLLQQTGERQSSESSAFHAQICCRDKLLPLVYATHPTVKSTLTSCLTPHVLASVTSFC
eukprot:GHVU01086495.1.p1 GENE.GHVU01086495.1~~GHVU01086495.1.p1  ORF type:complete len:123 (+),score=4.37 GHVU01086495.1:970-1338(+)